ncbi:MAG: hypothetical protein IPP76_14140 [Moraxellaceae bacterium]|nr:hypothetical protein [Moraxellaceae bacterium]
MAFIRPQHALSTLCIALLLTACNSNNEDNIALPSISSNNTNTTVTTNTITVTPSLGKIFNANVILKMPKLRLF